MSYCPKCGNKIDENMMFCPKCGAALKKTQASTETAPRTVVYRNEKNEKDEKHEKGEKTEKHEKRVYGFMGPLIGGLILILIGLTAYLELVNMVERRMLGALFFVIVGVAIIIGVAYGATLARKRHP
ncbi:zinc-ribbon domain-containing protein [Candidatus Bathyarchaeota archaeon]|nr:zinc-ribbon domain-containing protein [Candidatus Bathyarchaeota archaeon]